MEAVLGLPMRDANEVKTASLVDAQEMNQIAARNERKSSRNTFLCCFLGQSNRKMKVSGNQSFPFQDQKSALDKSFPALQSQSYSKSIRMDAVLGFNASQSDVKGGADFVELNRRLFSGESINTETTSRLISTDSWSSLGSRETTLTSLSPVTTRALSRERSGGSHRRRDLAEHNIPETVPEASEVSSSERLKTSEVMYGSSTNGELETYMTKNMPEPQCSGESEEEDWRWRLAAELANRRPKEGSKMARGLDRGPLSVQSDDSLEKEGSVASVTPTAGSDSGRSRMRSVRRSLGDDGSNILSPAVTLSTPAFQGGEEGIQLILNVLRDGDEAKTLLASACLRKMTQEREQAARLSSSPETLSLLVSLLQSPDPVTQEHAITSLCNLATAENVKAHIFQYNGVPLIVNLLGSCQELSGAARQNAAATLFLLAEPPGGRRKGADTRREEENRRRVEEIRQAGAVPHLLSLLEGGTPRGKKDALLALFSLAWHEQCGREICEGGGMHLLLDKLETSELEDKAIAVIRILVKTAEGEKALLEADGVSILTDSLDMGTEYCKDHALDILLLMLRKHPNIKSELLGNGVIALNELSQVGSSRAKAQKLLDAIRGRTYSNGLT